jgi:IS605 OrfB family transposase
MKKNKKTSYCSINQEELLKNKINENSCFLWIPEKDKVIYDKINTNSWFNFNYYKNNELPDDTILKFDSSNLINSEDIKNTKIYIDFNKEQKNIIKRWFYSYVLMYNETLKFIKNNKNVKINYKTIRTYHLKEIRNKIIKNSQHPFIKKDTTIKTHILDTAIKLACANYKSALTNLKRGNIKHFRIRYWKFNKTNFLLEIEPSYFKNGILCPKILGNINYYTDVKHKQKYELKEINNAVKLMHDKLTDNYYLFIPEKVNKKDIDFKKDFISLDPGLRTFMTGISNNEVLEIGTNINDKITSLIIRKNKILKKKIKECIKRKIEKRLNNKIRNLVTDLHWKTINFLTNNYKTILVGDMSSKSIINNKTSTLSKVNKQLANALSFYKFREKLQYKSSIKNNNYIKVNECYTSKTCSNCSFIKKDLGSNKIFNCNNCNLKQDRDVNASRNICLKMTL